MNDNMEATYRLTPMQQGMLFHHLSATHSGIDFEQIECELREPLDREAMVSAWQQVAAQHAAFRSRYRWHGLDEPVQEVLAHIEIPLAFEDWRSVSESEQGQRYAAFLEEDR